MIYKKHTQILIALVCLVIGFMVSTQIKTAERQKSINVQRVEDLSDRLQNAEKENERLNAELKIAKESSGDALLTKEISRLKLLSGEISVEGPGITFIIDDSKVTSKPGENNNLYIIHDEDILRVINELRAAGAEAIAINGQRIMGTSEIRCAGPTVVVNNTRIAPPFNITAIGNPQVLESSLQLRGGVMENFKFWGIKTEVSKSENIKIPEFKQGRPFEFIKPIEEKTEAPKDSVQGGAKP